MSEGRNEHKQTLFDKQGPEAIHTLRTISSLGIPIVAGALIGGALAVRRDFSGALVALFGLGGSLILAAWWWFCIITIRKWVGQAFGAFIQPSGPSYERQYSHEDALVMRGDAEGALASYERIMLEAPDDAQPRIRAADLYAKSGLRERAELLYRAVQRLPNVASRNDIYASNRLVDLYLAWPGHETRGLRELRRLVDTYPETDVAERAREGLVNLKSQLGVTE
jgi:hypothetical protein